ncbi:MAG: nitroreductase family protein [Lentisphaerota bacterium]
METLKAISARRSIRAFEKRPIVRDVLERIVDAGRLAATARNEQPWEFVVVTEPATLHAIGGLADHGKFVADASACIAVLCKDSKYYLEDGSAATQNLLVAAADLGVATCWVAGDKKAYGSDVLKLLGAPAEFKLVSLVAMGYAARTDYKVPKRELASVLHWERF